MLRRAVLAATVAAVVGSLLATGALKGGPANKRGAASAALSAHFGRKAPSPSTPKETAAAFAYLSRQTSNNCGLTAAALARYAPSRRLQGSCCDPMDLITYEWQVAALGRYSTIAEIPRDPYDVPVAVAQRLLRYDSSIHLSRAGRSTYTHAMAISREHGPCCCHCWRWNAFRGLSKHLIADRGWPAAQVAVVIDDIEGCGGKNAPPTAVAG